MAARAPDGQGAGAAGEGQGTAAPPPGGGAPAGEGNGQGDAAGGASGGTGGEGAGGGQGGGQGGANGGQAPGEGTGQGAQGQNGKAWFETIELGDDDLRNHLINSGFHKAETPEAALAKVLGAHRNAERRLGRPADQLLTLPEKDADPAEWRRQNGAKLGVPDSPDGYEFKRPEGWPDDLKWDEGKAKEWGKRFHARGVPKDIAEATAQEMAAEMRADYEAIRQEMTAAEQDLRGKLMAEWGGQAQGNKAMATRAFIHFAKEAKIPPESMAAVQRKLMTEGVEDAQVVRLFHAIGKAMGEDLGALDSLAMPGSGGAMTPAEAKAREAQITAADGEYNKAQRAGDRGRMTELKAELERLAKIQAQGAA